MTDETMDTEREAESQRNEETAIEGEAAKEEVQDRIAQLEEGIAARDVELAALKESLASAVAKYRTAVLATVPEVPEELVKGETVEEIAASLEAARGTVARIKQQLEIDAAANSVPAGAPGRAPLDLEGLTGEAKIKVALSSQPK